MGYAHESACMSKWQAGSHRTDKTIPSVNRTHLSKVSKRSASPEPPVRSANILHGYIIPI
jgi:hypothetical protein